MVMYKIDRRGGGGHGGSKNRSLGQTQYTTTFYGKNGLCS